jgi:hypothetical protein
MKEEIKSISIRARVAFIILCIENAIDTFEEKKEWDIVLSILWKQSSLEYVDEWLYICSYIMPDSILKDEYEENDTISIEDYKRIKLLYTQSPKYIFDLLECVFECGTIELYGRIVDNSEKTVQSVLNAIEIMKENHIRIPAVEMLKKYSITENDGWGRIFKKHEIVL